MGTYRLGVIDQFTKVLHIRRAINLSSFYRTITTENSKMWAFSMQQGPTHYVPSLHKRSRVCCFLLHIEVLRITMVFVVTLSSGLRIRLKGRCEGYKDMEREVSTIYEGGVEKGRKRRYVIKATHRVFSHGLTRQEDLACERSLRKRNGKKDFYIPKNH